MEFPFVRLSVNAASVGESSGAEKRGGGGGVREREKKKGSQRKSELFQWVFKKKKVKLSRVREVPGSRWTVHRSWVSLLGLYEFRWTMRSEPVLFTSNRGEWPSCSF